MKNTAPKRRKKQLIHWGLQTALVGRAMFHWLLSLVAITACTLILWLLHGAAAIGMGGATAAVLSVWKPFAFVLLGAVSVLPVIVIDLLKITNRVAGPLVKLNNELTRLSQGKPVSPISFREQDYCLELVESFNAVLARVQKLEAELEDERVSLAGSATAAVAASEA